MTIINQHITTQEALKDEGSEKFISPQKISENIVKCKIDYEEGDLFYGLSRHRLKFLRRNFLDKDLDNRIERREDGKIMAGSSAPISIDTINNMFLGTGAEFMLIKDKEERKQLTEKQKEEMKSFDRKKPVDSKIAKKFKLFLSKHEKYNPEKCPTEKDLWIRIGRACKGGLEYVTTKLKKKIHFVLDGIDYALTIKDLKKSKEDRLITGKELRWVYKHRENEKIMSKIIFYKDNVQTKAPWETDPQLWLEYEQHRNEKRENKK